MASRTAMENLLQEAGYTRRQAVRLCSVLDNAAIPGMAADDLYSAIALWRHRLSENGIGVEKFLATPKKLKGVSTAFGEVCQHVQELARDQLKLWPSEWDDTIRQENVNHPGN